MGAVAAQSPLLNFHKNIMTVEEEYCQNHTHISIDIRTIYITLYNKLFTILYIYNRIPSILFEWFIKLCLKSYNCIITLWRLDISPPDLVGITTMEDKFSKITPLSVSTNAKCFLFLLRFHWTDYLYALIFCNANYHRIYHQDIEIEWLINVVWFYKWLDLTGACITHKP